MNFIPFLQAAGAGASTSGSLVMTFVPFLIIILFFYLFIIMPQNKKQKALEKMIASLKKGDKVITSSGIHGVVAYTKEHTIVVKVDDNTKIEFSRSAIATVVSDKNEVQKGGSAEKKPESSGDAAASSGDEKVN